MDETPSSQKWDFQTSLPFKGFIKEDQDIFPLSHMSNQKKSTSVF